MRLLSMILLATALAAVVAASGSSDPSRSRSGLVVFSHDEPNGTSALFTVDPRSRRLARLTGPYSSAPGDLVWAPDGSISYAGDKNRITLVDPRSGRTRMLAAAVRSDGSFAWSPDGSRLVLPSASGGLVIRNRRGRLLRRLTNDYDFDPTWSPDGRTIAFTRVLEGVFVVSASGGRARRLVDGESPAWSPDGTQIVVSACVGGNTCSEQALFLVNASGGTRRRLTEHTKCGSANEPAWAPATRIAFVDCGLDGALGLADPQTGAVTDLGISSRSPSWSPDGSRLVVINFDRRDGLAIVDVAARVANDLPLAPHVGSDSEPAWAPDGRSLAAAGFPSLRIFSAKGVEIRAVPEAFSEPSWAPDGQRVIAQTDDCCTFSIVDLRTGQTKDVLVDEGAGDPTPCSPAWSPNGRWIAFAQSESLGLGLYDVRTDRERTLAVHGAHPDWSPDGRRLVFDTTEVCYGSPHRKRGVSVFVARVGSRHRRLLARNASDPAWSPDGRRIAFVRLVGRRNDPEIFVMNADGSRQRRLTHHPGWDLAPDWQPIR